MTNLYPYLFQSPLIYPYFLRISRIEDVALVQSSIQTIEEGGWFL